MLRVSDFTIQSYPPRDQRFETVQGVTTEDLDDAFLEAIEAAGRDAGSAEIVAARVSLHGFANLIRNSTWGAVLKLDCAQACLESNLRQLGIEPPPAPAARPLN
ncbi:MULTISPECIES: hypothetical protein [unclassified Methylobacterium]|uniref:hypothetical protein n=1 Tax=unclassified Methylobacterium TaxID=2615210 RepID=UPI000CB15B25|nr:MULTISPECIES: hypothetical protein [unclassified Methylobacterium]PIU06636.1 MAG: hypothetical protein COT56_08365 [Methylobacterium sp. CG09_land_8_20_14_0_10_71_15]PIU12104.1 MAG: hypothetical protein COT28_16880 [Methylobacterium sp. CG08_land_8_20_14_0_20_71_15]GBU19684.1 hypothetical protein AwMethylo_38990 [Methylobacterium sp.]